MLPYHGQYLQITHEIIPCFTIGKYENKQGTTLFLTNIRASIISNFHFKIKKKYSNYIH